MARSLYVIGGETGPQKIGISANVGGRLAALQSHSPHVLRAHHQAQPASDARLVESVAHQLLAAKRLRGEWFDVSIEEAIAAIDQAVALVDAGDLSLLKPSDTRMVTSLRIELDLLGRLKVLAVRKRTRVNDVIVEAIRNQLALENA